MNFLRQSTASQEVLLGPFLDDTDGKTAETGLTVANTDVKLFKHGATSEASKNSGGATHVAAGRYYAVLDATDTDTVGLLEVNVHVSGALPVNRKFQVLEEAVYDAFFAASAPGYVSNAPVNVAQFGGSNLTASGGRPEVNVSHWLGTACATPTVAGVPEVDLTHVLGAAASASDPATLHTTTIAALASQTSFTLSTGSADNSAYRYCLIVVTDASTATQKCFEWCSAYTGSTRTVTLRADPGVFTMAVGDRVDVVVPSSLSQTELAAAVWGVARSSYTTAGTFGHGVASVQGPVTGAVGSVAADGIVAASFQAGALTSTALAASYLAAVQAEAEEALQTYHLDHLIHSADPGSVVANSSFLAKLVSKSGTPAFASYDNTTDSLEALRDNVATAAELAKVPKSDGTASWNATALAAIQAEVNDGLVAHSLDQTNASVEAIVALIGTPAGASVSADVAAVKTDTGNLATRITSTLFTGITSLAQWLGAMAGKQAANSTARTEIRATGAGAGTFDEATDSQEALRDRGDAAWGGSSSLVIASGTVGSTGNTTTTLHLTGLPFGDDELNDLLIVVHDVSASEYHSRWVLDWADSGDLATVAALPFTPQNATDTYVVLAVRQDVTGGSGLDAAGVRAAVGLASANLDAQLGTIDDFLDTEVAAVKAKTDQLTFGVSNTLNANLTHWKGTAPEDLGFGGYVQASVVNVQAGAILAASIQDAALTAPKFGTGFLTTQAIDPAVGLGPIRSATAQGGAAGSITLDASASAVTNFYRHCLVRTTGGTGAGQVRLCTAYNGTTKVASVTPDWATTPDNTTTFAVLPLGPADVAAFGGTAGVFAVGRPEASLNPGQIWGLSTTSDVMTKLVALAVDGSGQVTVGGMAANVMNANALAADAVSEIQSGLATAAAVAALPTAAQNAAAWGASVVGNGRTRDYFLQGGMNKVESGAAGTAFTVYATDDSTPLYTATGVRLATSVGGLRSIDPA